VSNRYASGFWLLNQLGYLSAANYSVMIRQDLAGGNYGLVDLVLNASGVVVGYVANPDYFTTALFKRLAGPAVLAATVVGGANATGVRAWAYCAADGSGDITVTLSNFGQGAVGVSLDVVAAAAGAGGGVSGYDVYLLTPGDAALGLASQAVLLNGSPLALQADYTLPPMPAAPAPAGAPVSMPATSYAFVVLRGAAAAACAK
jgi:hypothetical protein